MSLAKISYRPPVLNTDRLVLRGFELTDIDQIYAYGSDPDVTQFVLWDRHRSKDDSLTFLNGWVATRYKNCLPEYAICLKETMELIGACGAAWSNQREGLMEMGYVLNKSAWGSGYAAEAGSALIEHCFKSLSAKRIEAHIFQENVRSQKAAEKMGLSFETVIINGANAQGRTWDLTVYSIPPTKRGPVYYRP